MKIAASTAVARDSAVVAPRAPNTVPEAPAPKPAPASAPLPRCSRTRPMMATAENNCTIVRIQRNIGNTRSSRSGSGQDAQKLIRLQRRATDQTAVDVRHGEEFRRVTGLDAAAVEDAGGGRNPRIPGADAGADEAVHFLRLVGRRVAAGADRPHRLVGDHALLEPARPAKLEHHIELPRDHLVRAPRVTIGELLADAQDRHEPPSVRGTELARDQLIALAIQQPPLRVPDDDVLAAHILQHRGRDLAGERPLRIRAQVLAAEARVRAAQQPSDLLQVNERRAHHAGRRRLRRKARQQLFDELRVLGARAVHLPVTGDNGAAHDRPRTAHSSRLAAAQRARDDSDARWVTQREGAAQPATSLTTAASSVAAARVASSSRPSTMTRITGSVPEGRSTTRPSPAMRCSMRATASRTAGTPLGSKRPATFTLSST